MTIDSLIKRLRKFPGYFKVKTQEGDIITSVRFSSCTFYKGKTEEGEVRLVRKTEKGHCPRCRERLR